MAPQKERLLRLAVSHHRNPEASEEEVHRYLQTGNAFKAAKIHAKYGVISWRMIHSPTPMQAALRKVVDALQNGWAVDDHIVTVEFFFRDIEELFKVSADPDFRAMQGEESPSISKEGKVATLGWVEIYVEDGVPIVDQGGYGTFAELSQMSFGVSN